MSCTRCADLSRPISARSGANNPDVLGYVSVSRCAIYIFETMSQSTRLYINSLQRGVCALAHAGVYVCVARTHVCACDIINPQPWGGLKAE